MSSGNECRELTVVDNDDDLTELKTGRFELPEGWTAKKVRRPGGFREDKYFYEPGTGKKFPSLRAVENYLSAKPTSLSKRAKHTPSSETPEQDRASEKHYKRRVRQKVVPLIADEKYFPGPVQKSEPKALKACSRSSSKASKRSSRSSSKASKRKSRSSSKALTKSSNDRSSRVRKSIVSGGKLVKLNDEHEPLAIAPYIEAAASSYDLPDGWVVEEVPRKNANRYKGYADKIYYEPGTGRKFLSLVSVKRHLAQAEAEAEAEVEPEPETGSDPETGSEPKPASEEDKPLALMFKIPSPAKKVDPKKSNSEKMARSPTFGPATPPARIKWVITDDTEGSTFKPFIDEAQVADSVVQQWANRFMISINGENCTSPSFES